MFPLLHYVQNRKIPISQNIMKNRSWKDEETALLQPDIDYTLISCIVSVTAAVGMAATETAVQKIALIFNYMTRCSDLRYTK